MKDLQIQKMLITPSIAREMLERNKSNRRISEPKIMQYVNDMANGKWKEGTGEMIKIATTGRILDGQHRLLAIIKANVSLYFYIVNNLEESVFDVLDTGKSRNSSDCFTIAGIKNSNQIPAIIAFFNLLEEGRKKGIQINSRATNAMLLEQYYDDENYWQAVNRKTLMWYQAFAKILSPSYIGGFYAHLSKLNSDKAEQFMVQLCTGVGSNATINLLRNKLMQDKMSPRKMTANLKMALIIKTWNHFISGKNVKLIKFDATRDEFPKAIKG